MSLKYGFELKFNDIVCEMFVKVESEPSQNEEGKWLPFKTILTVNNEEHDAPANLWVIFSSIYDLGADTFLAMENNPIPEVLGSIASKLGTGILTKYTKLGIAEYKWELSHLWPNSIDFGDLCYSSDPTTEIGIVWRYFGANKTYINS